MSDNTKIAWAEASWNPIVGCSKISPGCANCYAEKMACRLSRMGQKLYQGVTLGDGDGRDGWAGNIACASREVWDIPRRWKRPRRIFVCSMGDLFHERAMYEYWKGVAGVAADCPQHTLLVLTKRAEIMREALTDCGAPPNVWAGVTCEDQQRADERIPDLLATPAAVRWVSVEPMLGPVNIRGLLLSDQPMANCQCGHGHGFTRCPNTGGVAPRCHKHGCDCTSFRRAAGVGVHWVVIGAESGPKRRPCNVEWVRSLVGQCREAGVAVFVKQLDLGGRVVKDMAQFPEDLRIREYPVVHG
jgi:protein gp37